MKGSEVLLGQRIRVYQDRDPASRHTYAVVFMDRRFDRGQYEALLMDDRPLDPVGGFCVWGQRRDHYQRGKRMRYGALPKQCRLVLVKTLMKDESVRHWFLDHAENLRSDEIAQHLFFRDPLSFDPPLWLKSSDLYLFLDSGMLKALKDPEIVACGVLALSGSIRGLRVVGGRQREHWRPEPQRSSAGYSTDAAAKTHRELKEDCINNAMEEKGRMMANFVNTDAVTAAIATRGENNAAIGIELQVSLQKRTCEIVLVGPGITDGKYFSQTMELDEYPDQLNLDNLFRDMQKALLDSGIGRPGDRLAMVNLDEAA